MTPDAVSGFEWIIGQWEGVVLTLLTATEPVLIAVSQASISLIFASGLIWVATLFLRPSNESFIGKIVGGIAIYFLANVGLSPSKIDMPSGVQVQATSIQALAVEVSMTVHGVFTSAIEKVVDAHTVAGHIVPAQAAADDIAARGAAVFAGSDLQRLLLDYNQYCAPSLREVAGDPAKVDALHAVGLLGGGGIGIPDEEVTLVAQARAVGGGFFDFVFGSNEENGGWFARRLGGGAALEGMNRALDISAIRERRAAGIEYLENDADTFMGGSYVLPTESHWRGLMSGSPDGAAGYIPISALPGVGHPSAVVNPDAEPTRFRPASCLDAYKIAQLGAEAAYKALRGSVDGQRVSSEAGAIGSIIAWQRMVSRSLQNTTDLSENGANTAAGSLAVIQAAKDLFAWLDLQTLLPIYIVVSAWIYWFVVLIAPLALLIAPIMGTRVVFSWLSLLALPVVAMILVHAMTIAVSLVMAAVAIGQAAAVSGWSGAGANFDVVRGTMGVITGMILLLITWISAQLTGASPSALSGVLSGGVVRASEVASGAATVVSRGVMRGSRNDPQARKRTKQVYADADRARDAMSKHKPVR